MLIALIIFLLFCMGLTIIKAILGPTVYDRILAANIFGTHTVLLVIAFSYYTNNKEFIDIAIIYGLINFITTIALLKYFKYNSFKD